MEVGTAVARPGEITRGRLVLAEYPDGEPVTSPVMIACGRPDGPVLWVQALIHGGEVVGPIAIQRFLAALDLGTLNGAIVALMSANSLAMRAYSRNTPQDGVNLNRIFPGNPEGTLTEQLAARLLDVSSATADALLDLHSGGELTITCHYTLFHDDDSAAGRESARLARCSGALNVWNSLEPSLSGCMFTHFTKRGKPALIVERGGGARVEPEDIAAQVRAIRGVAQGLGMLPGEPERPARVRLGGNAVHLKCSRGGYFEPLVGPGDDVVAGQALGRIVNAYGDEVETTRCPAETAWVGSIRRPYMPIYSGDQVFELVESLGYEPA